VRTGAPLAPGFVPRGPDPSVPEAARGALGLDPHRPLLLVLGGSQGAAGLNRFVAEEGDVLLEAGVQVLHQTGPGRAAESGDPHPAKRAVEYLDDVPTALRAATLVLCRGGASTIAEVGAVGVPAWVVPYPYHADRHQEHNARELGDGVRLVPEGALDRGTARDLAAFCGNEGHFERDRMTRALEGRVPVDAADRVLDELIGMARS
jgi:UDP-N-acetylglucosamine--N-acetylmuramyl-(pentapeptide) pyrophosphoryl-undecaprenol N-acetylglucosamine transferase